MKDNAKSLRYVKSYPRILRSNGLVVKEIAKILQVPSSAMGVKEAIPRV